MSSERLFLPHDRSGPMVYNFVSLGGHVCQGITTSFDCIYTWTVYMWSLVTKGVETCDLEVLPGYFPQ